MAVDDVDFTVTHVWKLPTRETPLITGQLNSGTVDIGTVLHDTKSGKPVRIVGVDLHGFREPNQHTFAVHPDDTRHICVGQRLIRAPSSATATDTE
ncbi:hypothetical protein [Nocardia wallacei]|uniref:hypothetical protein n=1 Tax=Nocardia wallacei TaxID=480035 RepID=UPI0024574C03|nr:hypothetical protein [Nocardia wallacei]